MNYRALCEEHRTGAATVYGTTAERGGLKTLHEQLHSIQQRPWKRSHGIRKAKKKKKKSMNQIKKELK